MKDTLTMEDVLKSPTAFLYIFATDNFLSQLDNKTAKIISSKRRNQKQLLVSIVTSTGYNDAVQKLSKAIQDAFGYTPARILIKLAEGETVAGKDWANGVYGVGATRYEGFSGTDITVDRTTGKIMQNGQEVAGQTAVYGGSGKKSYTTYTATVDGTVYTSQYKDGSYYAGNYTNSDGNTYSADGSETGLAGFSNIWSSISSFLPYISAIVKFVTSLFPDLYGSTSMANRTYITASNTIPSQSDGFLTETTDWKSIGVFAGIAAAIYAIFDR